MEIEEKIDKLTNALSKLFPGLRTQILKLGTLKELDKFQELYTYVLHQNSNLLNSDYFYKDKSLVHFTKVDALESILQEKAIRLNSRPRKKLDFKSPGIVFFNSFNPKVALAS